MGPHTAQGDVKNDLVRVSCDPVNRSRIMHLRSFSPAALILAGIGTSSWACSSEFEACEETRSCPGSSGGKGGAGGAAGSAGNGGIAGSAGAAGTAGKVNGGGTAGTSSAGSSGANTNGGATANGGTSDASGAAGDDPTPGGASGNSGAGSGQAGSDGNAGGDSGEAGGAGAGGQGGSGEELPCEHDSDCNDGLFCNGVATCEDGVCKLGAPPCENTDPDHCTSRCEEGAGSATCVFEAIDDDDDGFGSAQCAANPGTDCDDGDDDVNPDAAEECDGVDNDCNGKTDFEDGLVLAGDTSVLEGGLTFDLAPPSPGANRFEMLHNLTGLSGMYRATVELSGAITTSDTALFDLNGSPPVRPLLSLGSGAYGVAFLSGVNGSTNTGFFSVRTLGFNGAISANSHLGATQNPVFDIAWRDPSEDWVVGLATVDEVQVVGFTLDRTKVEGSGRAQVVSALRIASLGSDSALIWQNENTSRIEWARVSSALEIGSPQSVTTSGYQPDITDVAGGYAMAWTTGSGLGFARAQANGAAICSNTVNLSLGSAANMSRVALANSERGVLALVTSEDTDKVILVRFDDECEPRDVIPVGTNDQAARPVVAVGSGRVALGWNSASEDAIFVRVVTDRLCK